MTHSFRLLACGFAVVLLLVAVAPAQQPAEPDRPEGQPPPVTFRVEVNYVEVDAIVTDQRGNFVRDLTQADFQVLENGKPQDVSVFAMVDIPIERAEQPLFADAPIEPDVRSNSREFDGRLYVLVLDDLHTHPLRSPRVKAAARRFIERHLGANDLAAVVHTSGRADASQDFTSNRRLLLAAVDRFMGRKLRSSTHERIDEYYRRRNVPGPRSAEQDRLNDPLDMERGAQARAALQTLQNISEWLGGVRGRRKALVLISEGVDYDIYDVFNARMASTVLDHARDAVAAATRANVNIYALDPRGLTTLGDELIEVQSLPDDPTVGLGMTSFYSEARLGQDSLRVLADETGGFAAVTSNDFEQAFDRLVRENSSYYVLGYYASDDRRDGRFRKIDVRVTRPGLQVRARKGYVAPRGRAPQPRTADAGNATSSALREVLDNPLPVSGLTFTAFAAPFKGSPPKASVLVGIELAGRDLEFTDGDGVFLNDVEVSLVAFDHQGKVQGGDRSTLELKLRPETREAVAQHGFRFLSRIELTPGRYQIRLASRESGAGRTGSVHYDLEVPDFTRDRLTISGLVLTSVSARWTPTARPDQALQDVLPGPPTARREFVAGDTLALFTEVYDNEPARSGLVDIVATLRSDDGRVLFKSEEQREAAELQGTTGGYGYAAQIPLRGLAPGLYVLRVEAAARGGRAATVSREVLLRILPDGPPEVSGR